MRMILAGVGVTIITSVLWLVLLVKGPQWETKLFPIVEDVKVTIVSEDREVKMQTFKVTANKVRSCDAKAIMVLVGESKDAPLRRIFFALKEDPMNRARGLQSYDGTVIGEVGNYIRVDTIHRCHPLWDTVSSPWVEWTR